MGGCCPIVELRRYTLRPGQRDTLIDLFERELIESQEAAGMQVLGQFRDADDPDAFVWLRGFSTMESRREALARFYYGPVWGKHRDAANATMVDSDDVRLLRPVSGEGGFAVSPRPPVGATALPTSMFTATIWPVDRPDLGPYNAGAPVVARFRTEHAENTFPALPVRSGEDVFVWFSRFETPNRDAATMRLLPTARSALR
jgi:hypothetical protein